METSPSTKTSKYLLVMPLLVFEATWVRISQHTPAHASLGIDDREKAALVSVAFAMISGWWPQGLYNPGCHGGFYSSHLLALVEFVIVGSTQYFAMGHEITV